VVPGYWYLSKEMAFLAVMFSAGSTSIGQENKSHDRLAAEIFKEFGTFVSGYIQGADDKLGQFLDQDFEASANHRNVLRHSLESCPSLVSPNVKKTINIYKNMYRMQNTKLVQ
jgi:hypothetical protein